MNDQAAVAAMDAGEPMPSPSWQIKSAGEGIALDGELTLRYYKIQGAEEENRFAWEVYAGAYDSDPIRGPKVNRRLGSSENLPLDERPKSDGDARIGAERFAFELRAEPEEFPAGFEVQLPASWLVKQLGLEDAIANNGGWGSVPTEAVVLITCGLDSWACATTIAGFNLMPHDDDEARQILTAWERHRELQGVASASSEAAARAESRQTALDGVRAACGEPVDEEPEELDIPARTADLVRTEDIHAFVGLSDDEKLAIGDELVEAMRLQEVEEDAKKAAVESHNKKIREYEASARQLARKHREGGERVPVPHRLEFYHDENVVVVKREDTGEVTDVRRMTSRERQCVAQGELPLDVDAPTADGEEPVEQAPTPAPEPFELVVGMDLVSTGGSGGMVRVLELHPADPDDEDGEDRVTIQKLTKSREIDGRAKPQVVAKAGLFAAYRPLEEPQAPETAE